MVAPNSSRVTEIALKYITDAPNSPTFALMLDKEFKLQSERPPSTKVEDLILSNSDIHPLRS